MDGLADYPGNRGPFVARMRIFPDQRLVVLDLAPGFTFGLLTESGASGFARQVRQTMRKWFGSLKFDPAGLDPYVRCTADAKARLVRVDFLPPSGVAKQGFLAANPEMLLALAETLEQRAAAIGAAAA
jgi:hypothetical protein